MIDRVDVFLCVWVYFALDVGVCFVLRFLLILLVTTFLSWNFVSTFLFAGDVMANYAHVTTKDIPASNGVIHAIDHLLFPMDMLAELRQLYNQYDKTTTAAPSG